MKIVECPRDAMQGIANFIPTNEKIAYLNILLEIGFDILDFGSFVSPKAIPQMKDTAKVLEGLIEDTNTELLAIIANERGANDAASFDRIRFLGYPFSVSETFQLRNTKATIKDSLRRVEEIKKICERNNKDLLVYLSMAFGNPYGDPWDAEVVAQWVDDLKSEFDLKYISLADTIGVSKPETITYLFKDLIPAFRDVKFGAHLHTSPTMWEEKIKACVEVGCERIDGAILGYGGCPMAKEDLVGNMPTEKIISFLDKNEKQETEHIDLEQLQKAVTHATTLFNQYN